jgi:hypothetical protein
MELRHKVGFVIGVAFILFVLYGFSLFATLGFKPDPVQAQLATQHLAQTQMAATKNTEMEKCMVKGGVANYITYTCDFLTPVAATEFAPTAVQAPKP